MQVGRTSPAPTMDMVGDEQGSTNPSLLAAPHAASMPSRAPSSLEHGKPCGLCHPCHGEACGAGQDPVPRRLGGGPCSRPPCLRKGSRSRS